ncbi:MAG: hypothetical protein B6D41_14205, partial [Chloroflexi bacterium UTCFX4]
MRAAKAPLVFFQEDGMTRGRVIGLGIGIFLIGAAFGLVLWQGVSQNTNNVAFAQGAATATPSASATVAPSTAPQTQTQPQTIGDDFWAALAAKLGVSADDLKSKALETRQAMIDAAVKDGRITQAQADAIKKRMTSNSIIAPVTLPRNGQGNSNKQNPKNQQTPRRGPGQNNQGQGNNNQKRAPFGNGSGMMPGRNMMGGGLQELEAVAKTLKLETKALIEQVAQGKSLADIAKAQNVDEAAVKQAIIDARTAQIDQLLSYGLISQVQADQMKARLTPEQIDLSRPLWFRYQAQPNMPKSMQLMPGLNFQMFGNSNGSMTFPPNMMTQFGHMFGMGDSSNQTP